MKKLTMTILPGCPYCAMAREIITDLKKENKDFAGVEVTEIDESAEPERAGEYDYYYVPSFFLGKEKLYETSPSDDRDKMEGEIRAAFKRALNN